MITVTVEQKRGATTRRMQVSASSIERALETSGASRPDTNVRVVFPIDAETFFAPATQEGIDYTSMSPQQINRAAFTVAENHLAGPGERYAVSSARVTVLKGRTNPLPDEPFTTYFSRRTMAVREYARLYRVLG